ncbi:MAG: hypothetical protein RQ966_05195 [Acetobacteraceae bacterium]|nr:hypothetical protein [Acetobacteraceae bacterium]
MTNVANPLLWLLTQSARRGSLLLAVGIFGGAVFPPLAAAFHPIVAPLVFGMMTLIFLRVDFEAALAHLRRPGRVGLIVAAELLVSPLVMAALVGPLGLDRGISAGLVLFAAGCAATSSPAFARMVGLDPELSLVVSLVTTFLVPLTAPPLAIWLTGVDLAIGAGAFSARLLLIVGLPAALSLLVRRLVGPARLERWAEAVDGALVWLVVGYGFGVMDGLQARLAADPEWVVIALSAAFLADYGLNVLTTLALWPLGRVPAASAGLMAGNRNMALFLAVLPSSGDPRVPLFFALCQFPLFLSPFLLRPLYRRLV